MSQNRMLRDQGFEMSGDIMVISVINHIWATGEAGLLFRINRSQFAWVINHLLLHQADLGITADALSNRT